MLKRLLGISFCLLLSATVGAITTDSTLARAEHALSINNIEKLEELATEFVNQDGARARLYENFFFGVATQRTGRYETSEAYFRKAIEIAEGLEDSCWLGKTLHYLSITYFFQSRERALIRVGRRIVDEHLECVVLAKTYLSIGAAFRQLKSFDTARVYLDLALDLGRKKDSVVVPYVYNHIADIHAETGDSLTAINIRRNVLKWLDTLKYPNHKVVYSDYLLNISRDYINAEFLDSGITACKKGLAFAIKKGYRYKIPLFHITHAGYWSDLESFDSANYYYLKAFSAAERGNNTEARQLALENIQIALGNKIILQELKSEKASLQRNISILIGAGVLLLCLLLIRLSRQRTKHQEVLRAKDAEVHQKELEGLLAGQEVQVVEALVEGQEHERKRLSQELHDTIGSMLATLKLQFESLTDLFDVSNDKQESKIEFTNDLLDRTCIEVRRISHNLSSGMVSKVGVVEAIRQVSNNINSSGKLAVEFVSEVDDINLQGDAAVHLFRVVQELFSNIIKHSKASKLSVQISAFENEVTLIIEDNGVGFDYQKALREGKGLGLSNLATRVQQLNGQLNIDSAIGRGTTAIIELTV